MIQVKYKFYNTDYEEQETIINIDYFKSELYIYTCRKMVYSRLIKKIGQPIKTYYIGKNISGAKWVIPFTDKKTITSILSRPLLIGNMK